jgi:hypothetical protein
MDSYGAGIQREGGSCLHTMYSARCTGGCWLTIWLIQRKGCGGGGGFSHYFQIIVIEFCKVGKV